MDYPEELKLSPGMSANLAVVFKPGKGPSYTDKIVFSTAKGAFTVRLEGKQPNAELGLPSYVDFGFAPVKETTLETFVVGMQPLIVMYRRKLEDTRDSN
jgi:hypothetical protein